MNCTLCGKPIKLIPSASERAKKFGGKPQDYVKVFTTHPFCLLQKRNQDTLELIRRTRNDLS